MRIFRPLRSARLLTGLRQWTGLRHYWQAGCRINRCALFCDHLQECLESINKCLICYLGKDSDFDIKLLHRPHHIRHESSRVEEEFCRAINPGVFVDEIGELCLDLLCNESVLEWVSVGIGVPVVLDRDECSHPSKEVSSIKGCNVFLKGTV